MDITVHFAARAIDAVRRVAAEEILPRYGSVVSDSAGAPQPRRKDDGSIVTEADLAEQRAVFERGATFWCVDPLDGSKNFSAGVPYFAVSVALMEGTRAVFGTVYDPRADEAYYAVHGGQKMWDSAAGRSCSKRRAVSLARWRTTTCGPRRSGAAPSSPRAPRRCSTNGARGCAGSSPLNSSCTRR